MRRLLQCAIPVFEGLFPAPHNKVVLKLLYLLAFWHGLAKLRMHTDLTLTILDAVTTALGKQFREFATKTCPEFKTCELEREANARIRRTSKVQLSQRPTNSGNISSSGPSRSTGQANNSRKLKS